MDKINTDNKKEINFKKLAEHRVNEAKKYLRLVGNLFNRHHYTYTDKQADEIIKTLKNDFEQLKSRLNSEKSKQKNKFKLDT